MLLSDVGFGCWFLMLVLMMFLEVGLFSQGHLRFFVVRRILELSKPKTFPNKVVTKQGSIPNEK